MNINIQTQGRDLPKDNLMNVSSGSNVSRMTKTASECIVDISGRDKDISSFGISELKSFDEVREKASIKDVSLENNALAVMSNSMSGEDFAKAIKDGFSPEDMTPEETVTNLDKIKATLVKSGVNIPGYTDDLSTEKIEQIAGSSAYAGAIESALRENQLPIDKENVKEIADVLKLSESTSEPQDDAKKYMINNDLEPTVNNFYIANHSSSETASATRAGFYKDATGYVGKNPTDVNMDELKPQVEKIITEAGFEVNDKTLLDAKWLIEKDIPLTGENLEKLQDINSVNFPLEKDVVAKSAATAIADGTEVKEAPLTKLESYATMAGNFVKDLSAKIEQADSDIVNGKLVEAFEFTGTKDEISARRLLEETRLALTVEASTRLLKKGIKLDTTNLQNLVEELKQAEKEVYAPFLMDEKMEDVPSDKVKAYDDELTLKLDLFKQTTLALEDIKSAPIETFSDVVNNADVKLSELADSARAHKADYDRANKSYETMMTEPRRDLGDSIKKAFRNVDDILEDLEVEVTRLNEKAVRILGYAGIEINESNIETASKAEVAVENVISHMTPARTLKMIRDGENPLDTDIYKLSEELMNEDEDLTNIRYTEFLYKLDKSGEITESEKKAFIGLYRLFKKIEKSDGKLIGDVIKADEKLTLSNIISASRSDRQVGTDIKIDDNFGTLEKLVTYGESITEQILQGFSTKENNEAYAKEEAEDVKNMISKEEAVIQVLENVDEPHSPINMAAVDMLMNARGSLFKGINAKLDDDEKSGFEESIADLQDGFEDEESVKEAYKTFSKKADEIIKKQVENADNYIDVKSLKLMNKQLSIMNSMAESRNYEVPVMINGELTSINLKLVSDSENAGKVSAYFESEDTGKVSAQFELKNGEVTGTIITQNSYFEESIKAIEDNFKSEFEGAGVKISNMYYVSSRGVSVKGNYLDTNGNDTPATKQLYLVAKAIIKAVQK